jgi:fibrillarin-like pre-rRNA processing protein
VDPTNHSGVLRLGRDLYTENGDPGHKVYGEELRVDQGREFRRWDPFRSKLAAFLAKERNEQLWEEPARVLYLGGAHGTTVSHLSDALPEAEIFVIEKSPVAFAPLLALSKRRRNLLPILADAQLPERYLAEVGRVDLLYQDIAQRNQATIFVDHADAALRPGGVGLLMLKVRSVTQTRAPGRIVAETRQLLSRRGYPVRNAVELTPFSRDHTALTVLG